MPRQIVGAEAVAIWKLLNGDDSDTKARYAMLKPEFDSKVVRVLNPPGYAVKVLDRWVRYTRVQLKDVFGCVFIDHLNTKLFVDEWLRDNTTRTYPSFAYLPNINEDISNIHTNVF
jgi:hypothetical protein